MNNCKQCDKPLIHVEGRKKKQFCNVNCRNKYFYAQNKKMAELGKSVSKEAVTVTDLNKQSTGTVVNLTEEKAVTNYTVDTNPKTLSELKELCPKDLTGIDRSQWIALKRQEYGI